MAGLLLKQLGVKLRGGLPEVVPGIGTGRTLREPLQQILPTFVRLSRTPNFQSVQGLQFEDDGSKWIVAPSLIGQQPLGPHRRIGAARCEQERCVPSFIGIDRPAVTAPKFSARKGWCQWSVQAAQSQLSAEDEGNGEEWSPGQKQKATGVLNGQASA